MSLCLSVEIEWRKKAAEQGKAVEDDEFEDLTEDAKRLQEQELNKVRTQTHPHNTRQTFDTTASAVGEALIWNKPGCVSEEWELFCCMSSEVNVF